MNIFEVLELINVINYDNGKKFTEYNRLLKISELLWNSSYRRINPQGLFHLYSKVPLEKLPKNIVVVSTHVDCQSNITKCFMETVDNGMLQGTFDNSLTNAAILSLMLEGVLPDHIVIAFTGDEEEDSAGAKGVVKLLEKFQIRPVVVVLDVTDMGWEENCDFTIENNFWMKEIEEKIIRSAVSMDKKWCFVPEDINHISNNIPRDAIIYQEAEADESWEYDEFGVCCFSVCIPVHGDMHSNKGVLTRKKSVIGYREALCELLCGL